MRRVLCRGVASEGIDWQPVVWTRDDQKAFRKYVRELRELCPPVLPVRVRRLGRLDSWGVSYVGSGRSGPFFGIELWAGLGWTATFQILLHEWSHTLSWADGQTRMAHGPEWGLAMSEVYTAIVEG